MNTIIKEMLHLTEAIDYKSLIAEGGKIMDVRSHGE